MKLSAATAEGIEDYLNRLRALDGFTSVEQTAQVFVDQLIESYQESLVLARIFVSVPFGMLPSVDQRLVEQKGQAAEIADLLHSGTPVLSLLGTRGQRPEWNDRKQSQGFRCIPMISGNYVDSLSMLAMQFKCMGLDSAVIDNWAEMVDGKGYADQFSGLLLVRDAESDIDGLGRKIVPRQDFVVENLVKSVVGFGGGYDDYPSLVTLFLFTNEHLDRTVVEPFAPVLDIFTEKTTKLLRRGDVFAN